jgi:hypothetical protein
MVGTCVSLKNPPDTRSRNWKTRTARGSPKLRYGIRPCRSCWFSTTHGQRLSLTTNRVADRTPTLSAYVHSFYVFLLPLYWLPSFNRTISIHSIPHAKPRGSIQQPLPHHFSVAIGKCTYSGLAEDQLSMPSSRIFSPLRPLSTTMSIAKVFRRLGSAPRHVGMDARRRRYKTSIP